MSTSLSDPSIITLFRNAPKSSRRAFLSALSLEFHPSDLGQLHHILHENSFYFDFIPLLPLEISLQILRYLPLKELILLRLVSRRWNNILRSPDVCRSLTYRFFPNNPCIESSTDIVTLFENLSSRRQSLLRRKPSAWYKFHTYIPLEPQDWREKAYYVDADFVNLRMAWVEGHDRNSIVVRDLLDAGKSPEVIPKTFMDDRCRISEVALSDSLVVAVSSTMGVCQVWDLATRATHSFKIPGAVVATLHADSNIIGILLHRQNLEYQLIVHNAATRKTKCIDITCDSQYNGNQVIVHAASNRVVHVKREVAGEMDIEVTAWSIDSGESLGKVRQRFTSPSELRQFQPMGNGRWVIKARLSHTSTTMHISHWQLDLAQPKLEIAHGSHEVSIESATLKLGASMSSGVHYTGTSGQVNWGIVCGNIDNELSSGWFLVWEEGALEARVMTRLNPYARGFPPFFTPFYLDPHDRFILWGWSDTFCDPGEMPFLEWRGFEDTRYVMEIYRGIHECDPDSTH